MELVSKAQIQKAYEVLAPIITHTPLQYDRHLSEKYQATILLKREDLQRVRSFKLRGAYYAISQKNPKELHRGVVCASAGNHAQGIAYTCHELGIKAVIFMPSTTPAQKVEQVAFFGGKNIEIRLIGDTFDASANHATTYAHTHQMPFINPFDDPDIIAGQGSIGIEIEEDLKNLGLQADMILCAIGGGGLISGVASYFKNTTPSTKIIGVEPTGASSMALAFEHNEPTALPYVDKFVDGAAVQKVGILNFHHAKAYVDSLIHVDEGLVCQSILELYNKQAIIAEPAGALSVAALETLGKEICGKVVVCIISGGNNDIQRMAEIEERSLIYQGLMNYFLINFPQRPGALKEFVNEVLGPNDDITRFEYTKKVHRGTGPVMLGILSKHKQDTIGLLERIQNFDPSYIALKDHQSLYTLLV
ncbi:threonine ammonia-lyase IlvA [Helicobacter mustelae]|uniref:L-threonine dehydratase n=1 Tax=Helicobacter mustelae (strain ATCC 43772 / CCUG 25715 / CIP 103759 / LMG 18044 / NCTC 12198 / R85-136P) TaxID=679897 RepID=D3UIW0_HELM1|nr:threonine ammonia-lyase IlvA [Helicobacter mustelae]CBG40435.1 threonine dehydratase biosynthetic [Helicobacter mustelae 12198]SQH71935.1 threonine dehydratase biosynthetic [Helicobacter mustelae]STP13076.1 threonine dehydratase biosynthetic [Helicobacter mustelae]